MTVLAMGNGGWMDRADRSGRRALIGVAALLCLAAGYALVALPWLFGGTERVGWRPGGGWKAPAAALGAAAPGPAGCPPASAKMAASQTANKGGSVAKILRDLERLGEGLLFPSESDYPLEPFAWRSAKPFSAEALLRECGYPEGTAVEVVEVDYFFRNVILDQEWHTPEDRENVRRFRKLLAYLKSELAGVSVYRVGEVSIDAYILGESPDGHVIGLKTTVIET